MNLFYFIDKFILYNQIKREAKKPKKIDLKFDNFLNSKKGKLFAGALAIFNTYFHISEKLEHHDYLYAGIYITIFVLLIVLNIILLFKNKEFHQIEFWLLGIEFVLMTYFTILTIIHKLNVGKPTSHIIFYITVSTITILFVYILAPRSKYLRFKGKIKSNNEIQELHAQKEA